MQNANAKKPDSKFISFIKNNLALIIIVACILAITTIVIIAAANKEIPADGPGGDPTDNPGDGDPTDNPGGEIPTGGDEDPWAKMFSMPLASYTSISMDFTNDTNNLFVFNQTLNKWEAHRAVDFLAPAGSSVYPIRGGTVITVGKSYGLGDYIEIDHGDGYVATYASLDNVSVIEGQKVDRIDVIGKVSDSASNEFKDGAHLHLSMKLNGAIIDPWSVLSPAF